MMLPGNVKRVHFIGIGGYGMSALAMILLQMGYEVSGSDLKSSRLTDRLKDKGAEIIFHHEADNIENCDLVVYSTAIPADNPELLEARARQLPIWHRADLLAALVNNSYGITVAGTHGKTTTTSMLALLLERGGLDPTVVIGGEVNYFDGNARLGKSHYLVAEACESDNSFLRYHPKMIIITNIEADHLENYGGDFSNLIRAYGRFLSNIDPDGCAIVCGEDPLLREKLKIIPCRAVTYGIDSDGRCAEGNRGSRIGEEPYPFDYLARDVSYGKLGADFSVYRAGKLLARVSLSVPGRHNVINALGAIAAAAELGVDLRESVESLYGFTGADRRFEIVGEVSGVTLVDDYAHHPTEIKATLQAARHSGRQKIICIFQPHRYSRTAYFLDQYARAFAEADLIFLHRIYPAGEKPVDGISSEVLAEMIRKRTGKPVIYNPDMGVLAMLAAGKASTGDMVITMGAGDIWKAGHMVREKLSE